MRPYIVGVRIIIRRKRNYLVEIIKDIQGAADRKFHHKWGL